MWLGKLKAPATNTPYHLPDVRILGPGGRVHNLSGNALVQDGAKQRVALPHCLYIASRGAETPILRRGVHTCVVETLYSLNRSQLPL